MQKYNIIYCTYKHYGLYWWNKIINCSCRMQYLWPMKLNSNCVHSPHTETAEILRNWHIRYVHQMQRWTAYRIRLTILNNGAKFQLEGHKRRYIRLMYTTFYNEIVKWNSCLKKQLFAEVSELDELIICRIHYKIELDVALTR